MNKNPFYPPPFDPSPSAGSGQATRGGKNITTSSDGPWKEKIANAEKG
jgi:hypothetical protein